ncbi:MAG: hypothetical protein H6834_11975 [Planctomycetes bacterium]|nr:hypothetical protein [Planctomycetota bacterium]
MKKRIGILYGMERSFPPAVCQRINELAGDLVEAEPVLVGPIRQDVPLPYDLIVDRISHEIPYYRTLLKVAVAQGKQVVNNPIWWSADDKFLGNVIARAAGVKVPKTYLLPHKAHPPNTTTESFTNLEFPIEWDEVFEHIGFPAFMKPADGGGWRDVYKVHGPDEFFAAYDRTGTLTMMLQEAIEFDAYYRCYVIGRKHVRVMAYEPRNPHHERYVKDAAPPEPRLLERLTSDALILSRELGYDFNTVELAMRGKVPFAIDFTNPAPDADVHSVGQENFDWVVQKSAEYFIERVLEPVPFELTGSWVDTMRSHLSS